MRIKTNIFLLFLLIAITVLSCEEKESVLDKPFDLATLNRDMEKLIYELTPDKYEDLVRAIEFYKLLQGSKSDTQPPINMMFHRNESESMTYRRLLNGGFTGTGHIGGNMYKYEIERFRDSLEKTNLITPIENGEYSYTYSIGENTYIATLKLFPDDYDKATIGALGCADIIVKNREHKRYIDIIQDLWYPHDHFFTKKYGEGELVEESDKGYLTKTWEIGHDRKVILILGFGEFSILFIYDWASF